MYYFQNELYHHGKKFMKWGVSNGPPYPLYRQPRFRNASSDEYKEIVSNKKSTGKDTYDRDRQTDGNKHRKNGFYNKKHVDNVIKTSDTMSTLSFNKDRLKDAEMFYTTYKSRDKDQYRAMFNRKSPQPILDENGNQIGTGMFFKYQIQSKAKNDIKVASEDSSIDAFRKLYETSKDFNNFVNDPKRMQSLFVEKKYMFKGYRESRDALENIRKNGKASDDDIDKIYRMFNYVLPNDGNGNPKVGADVGRQRAKFFKELKNKGYGALLDTNDSMYGGFKAHAPTIVFDMEQVIPTKTRRLNTFDKRYSQLAFAGKKLLNM